MSANVGVLQDGKTNEAHAELRSTRCLIVSRTPDGGQHGGHHGYARADTEKILTDRLAFQKVLG